MFDNAQALVITALWAITLAVKAYAVIDCVRRPAAALVTSPVVVGFRP